MYCIIDKGNKIQHSSFPLKEGLNVIGVANGIVTSNYELSDIENDKLLQDISPSHIDGEAVFIFVKDGRFVWASPDFSGIRDLFYAKLEDGRWVIGDEFFEILSQFRSLTLSNIDTIFFIRQGYFPPGSTFFKEVSRVRVGTKLVLLNGNMVEESAWKLKEKEQPRSYEAFKKAINSVLNTRSVSNSDAVFLSAGVDSGLLAALSVKTFSKHPLAVTVRYKQKLKINEIDAIGSERIASHLGLEHVVVDMDFNEERVSSLQGFIEKMPLAAHLSLPFLKMSREAAKRGKTKVWCGQNADSIYNFGPTEKTLGGPIKRFYLSKEYWKSLPDIKDSNTVGFLYKWLGALGPPAFDIKRGFKVRQPHTFNELMNAYEESEEYLALPSKNQKWDSGSSSSFLSYNEAKKLLFDRKVQSFIVGRDSRVVYSAAEQEHIKAILPYSATNMIHFFRGLELGIRDVFWPKQYIYRYLKELLGGHHFKSLYGSQEKFLPQNSYLSWQEWQKSVLFSTSFWQELRKEIEGSMTLRALEKKESPFFDKNSIYHVTNMYWVENVFCKVERMGVVIKRIN